MPPRPIIDSKRVKQDDDHLDATSVSNLEDQTLNSHGSIPNIVEGTFRNKIARNRSAFAVFSLLGVVAISFLALGGINRPFSTITAAVPVEQGQEFQLDAPAPLAAVKGADANNNNNNTALSVSKHDSAPNKVLNVSSPPAAKGRSLLVKGDLSKRNLTTTKKRDDPKYHSLFAPCATSVGAYCSSPSNFEELVPLQSSNGTFTILQDALLPYSHHDDGNDNHSSSLCTIVVKNENLKDTRSHMNKVLPTCRQLHPTDPSLCVAVDNKVPLLPLLIQADRQRIIYEMHVATFSPDGTFDGCISRLSYLVELGITTIQLMPVNIDYDSSWGYSTAHIFAIQSDLGGYEGLRRFIEAAHYAGLEVYMDVVYNHASARTLLYDRQNQCEVNGNKKEFMDKSSPPTYCPSNNFREKVPCMFGDYFYNNVDQTTPWGPRFNYSSKEVVSYLMSNVKYWVEELGIDGLRFDATVCIRKSQGSNSECWQPDAIPNEHGANFLRESNEYLSKMNRFSIAEDLQNDPLVTSKSSGSGLGFDAQWGNGLFYNFREAMRSKERKIVMEVVKVIESRCDPKSGNWISYTETHDIASSQADGHARTAQVVEDLVVNKSLLQSARVLPIALSLISCGTPMIFQGQELGEKMPFDYANPPSHDWEGFGKDWPGLDYKVALETPVCEPKSEMSEKKMVYESTKALLKIFSREYFFVKAGQDKLPTSSVAFDFELEDSLGGKLVGVLNFEEAGLNATSFSVPTPGFWKVVFDSTKTNSGDAISYYETKTVGDAHYIEALSIPPLATILLQPAVDGDLKPANSPQCRPSFLHSIKTSNLKFFNQTYWENHVLMDLYPFWSSSDALGGDEYGNFPTYRCDDGSAYDKTMNQCKEIEAAPEWITDYTDYDIAVQHSRQIFFYSVGYHLTGNSTMLQHAKAGIDVFFTKFIDGDRGAICTYASKVKSLCLPAENERTSMEHANALIGLAMYYYVTRDEAVGDFVFKSVDYTFSNWYREDWFMMGMANKTSAKPSVPVLEGEPLEVRKDMLAQLDQLNAYLMILRGLSRNSEQWNKRMLDSALALKDSFWDEHFNIMWGNANYKVLNSVHSDFGHSQKCLWFIMMTAEHLNDKKLFEWAYTRAMRMIPLAWLPRRLFHNITTGDVGTWAFDRTESGASNSGHVWWVYAELSQTAAFMSVSNPSIASAVTSKSYSAYMNLFLDPDSPQKGVFHWKDYLTHETLFAKGHVWKNGFHEAEHALMASISSAALQDQELRLFYAPRKDSNDVDYNEFYPGFFKGTISKNKTSNDDPDMLANHVKVAIDWADLRSTDSHPDPSCLGVSCSGNGICFEGECLCLHGWTGPKCDVNPCEDHLTVTTSKRQCDACTVTFKLNPSTIAPHPISKVMLAGSFSNWSAIEMELEQYDDSSNTLYSKLYPENSFYHSFSNSRLYSVDIDIPNGQDHTYKFVLDDSLWTYDKCNPDAVSDGLITANGVESKDLNSFLHVSCPPSGQTCELAKQVRDELKAKPTKEEVDLDGEQKGGDDDKVDSGAVVQLFEWNFESVARECKRLGEEGWTAVQLSPINAHMNLGPNIVENYDSGDSPMPPLYPWWERYQQASFNIMSRSGSEAELKAATEVCAHYGVQVWVEVTLNSMNAAPCCDLPQSPSELPTCDNFFIDDSKSCAAVRVFPSADFDAGDLHSPPCGIGDIGTWGSPDITHNCDMTGLPDLDTSSDHVQRTLAKYLDHLLDLGVSGFRLLAVGHIDSKEVEQLLGRSKNQIRRDVFEKTKARSMLPTLILDLWPSWLVRFPHLQPAFYPDSMTPFTYNQLSSNAYNTDLAWSFAVGDTFYNKDESPTLTNLTELSVSTRFSHPMYKQRTDRIPLDKLILQLTNHFLTFYGVENCTSAEGTADVKGQFHGNVCPNVLSSTWNEHLLTLGSIWMMALPVGFTRIHSSYDWQRSYITNDYGRPFDTSFSSGPPRTYDGGTRSVSCDAANKPSHDQSPAFVEDGSRWMCEHRIVGIAAMPKWREEVAKAGAYQLKLNEWIGNGAANDLFVSISRSVRQGSNRPLKGGWVAINAHSKVTVKKQFATRLPAGTYRNGASSSGGEAFVVDSRGILEATLRPLESIIIHTGDMTVSSGGSIPAAVIVFIIFLWLLLPVAAYVWTLRKFSKESDIVLKDDASCAVPENGEKISLLSANLYCKDEETMILNELNKKRAMICTLEHIVPETALSGKINQKVGGLGKVMEVVAKFHPGELIMATPMMGGVSYPVMREAEPVYCEVEGKVEEVQIFHFRWPGKDHKVESIFCKHDGLFGKRMDKDKEMYPDDSDDLDYFLRFFTLWNQTVAKLAVRHRNSIDVLHLCDYHTSLAPTYIKKEDVKIKIPILCTLHNASYQGNIQNHLSSTLLGHISKISGIPEEVIFRDLTHDGQFNMLSGMISYIRKEQKGRGFCAVSKRYAKEVPIQLDCFRSSGMLKVRSLPNPELMVNRPSSLEGKTSSEEIRAIKKLKKYELQEALDLEVNPNAIVGAFVGRMVYQKGVDAIADAATELLLRHHNLQLIVVGPPGDIFGEYAATRLMNLAQNPLFKRRIFVVPKFYMFTPDHRLGCDFALMPSRSEPFGFVDIEFAHCGCPVIGSLVGGLGKTPGWYFKLWEGGDFNHIKMQLSATVSKAVEEGQDKLFEIGIKGISTSFPLINWQEKLHELYTEVEEIMEPRSLRPDGGNNDTLWTSQLEEGNLYLVNGDSDSAGVHAEVPNSEDDESPDETIGVNVKMEQNLHQKLLRGRTANVKSVFQSTVWKRVESVMNVEQSSKPYFPQLLKEIVMGRTVETWIICILSILMPSHSALIYAKAIVWASAYDWGDNFISGLYAVHTVSFAVGCLIWIQIMQRLSIGKCVCFSALLHSVYLLYFAPISSYGVALTMSFVTGLISSASGPVFTAAMFFDEWDGSLRSKVRNYGWLEGSRTCFSGIVQGFIINNFLSIRPSNEEQDDEASFIFSATLLIIYGCVASLTVLGASILYLGMKREMRTMILPRVPLSGIKSFQAYPLLALSQIIDGLISYPTLFVVSWLLLDGYSAKETGLWIQVSSIAQGFAIYCFSVIFNRYMEGRKCIGIVATFLINPVVLQALIMLSAPTFSTNAILILLALSSFLIKLKAGLISILKLHVLPSRWKVVTFSAYELFFSNIGAALSPFLIRSMSNAMSLSLNTVGPGTSAEASALALFYTVLPFVAVSTALQLFANRYTFKDMPEVYTKPFNNNERRDDLSIGDSGHSLSSSVARKKRNDQS